MSLASLVAAHFFPLRGISSAWARRPAGPLNASVSPLLPVTSASTRDFTGDDISRPHDILWHKESYLREKGGIPAATAACDTVIVGGGMSGLLSGYFLRDKKPILLEQAPQWGGNSKGESYGNSPFSIGAAYITAPEEGSEAEALLKELGIMKAGEEGALEEGSSILLNGALESEFWSGRSAPGFEAQFKSVFQKLLDIGRNQYPDLPYDRDPDGWDEQTFEEWMKKNLGEVHPQLAEFFQLYCWSSLAGSIDEISAYQMLNFITSDMQGVVALPGGNSRIAVKLQEKLASALPRDHLRSGAFVIDVAPDSEGVRVCYEEPEGALRTIRAKTCIYAAPKFTAAKVVGALPPEQLDAIGRLEYRAYLVGNIILKKKLTPPCYDLFLLRGTPPSSPTALHPGERGYTDVCFANWSYPSRNSQTVLTAYQALPYQGAKQFLFSPGSHDKYRREFEKNTLSLLAPLGIGSGDIEGIRLTRWGHSVPLAESGLLSAGIPQRASKSVLDRVFFANQDNWANPCFETALKAASTAVAEVRRRLG